jgi:hypothetical protein
MSDDQASRPRWREILFGGIIGAIIGPIIAFALPFFKSPEQTPQPVLRYTVSESPPLFGKLQNIATYTVEVVNSGNKEATALRGAVKFPGATIDEHRGEFPLAFGQTESVNKSRDEYKISSPAMNPSDRIRLSFVVNHKAGRSDPTIDVRAQGVVATSVSLLNRPRAEDELEDLRRQVDRQYDLMKYIVGVFGLGLVAILFSQIVGRYFGRP